MNAGEVDELLAGDRGAAEVRERQTIGQRLGISGVPFFVINDAVALSGAQAPKTFRAAFEQAGEPAEGAACEYAPAKVKRGC